MSQFTVLPQPNITVTPSGTQNVNLTQVGGSGISEGQKTMANSIPVAIASDQSAVPVSASSLPLPTGASTSANQTNGTQKTQIVDSSGNVIASTSNALNVQVENFPGTQPVSGTVAVTQSTSPWVVGQTTASNLLSQVSQPTASLLNATVSQATASSLNATVVQGTASNLKTQANIYDGSGNAITSTSSALDVNIKSSGLSNQSVNLTQVGGSAVALGSTTSSASIPVVIASDQAAVTVKQATAANLNATVVQGTASNLLAQVSQPTAASLNATIVGLGTAGTPSGGVVSIQGVASGTVVPVSGTVTTTPTNSATSTLTNVNAATSSTSILASNTNRKGMFLFNDSTSLLYLAFGSTASTTSYTVQIPSNGFYEMPNPTVYTGAISGIWVAATGTARITELS